MGFSNASAEIESFQTLVTYFKVIIIRTNPCRYMVPDTLLFVLRFAENYNCITAMLYLLNFVNYAIFLCHIASTNILPKFLNHVVLLTHLVMHDNTTLSLLVILESGIDEILEKLIIMLNYISQSD